MTQEHTQDYYKIVFDNIGIILRIFHRDLNFGHLSVQIKRTELTIRWTVRRKGYKKFTHDIPITFDSIATFKDIRNNIYLPAEALVAEAIRMVPKELIVHNHSQ